MQQTRALASAPNMPKDADELRRIRIDGVFTSVPAGGDAAFATAVCGLPVGWQDFPRPQLAMLGLTEDVNRILHDTPHAVRSLGREYCSRAADDEHGADDYILKNYTNDKELAQARDHPADYIRDKLKLVNEQIADIDSGHSVYDAPAFSGLNFQRWGFEKTRDYYTALQSNPQAVSDLAKANIRGFEAAIEFQCPQISETHANDNRAGEPLLGRSQFDKWATGFGVARPYSFSVASTASSTVQKVQWESWGDDRAIGKGISYSGADKLDMYVIAFDLGDCSGHKAYRKMVRTENRDSFNPDMAEEICP